MTTYSHVVRQEKEGSGMDDSRKLEEGEGGEWREREGGGGELGLLLHEYNLGSRKRKKT